MAVGDRTSTFTDSMEAYRVEQLKFIPHFEVCLLSDADHQRYTALEEIRDTERWLFRTIGILLLGGKASYKGFWGVLQSVI